MYVLITWHITFHQLYPVWLCHIFRCKWHDFLIKMYWTRCLCLTFHITLMWNYSPFKEFSIRYYCKHTSILTQSTQYFCPILAKIKFTIQILIRVPGTKSHKTLSCGSWAAPYRWTDMVKLIIAFCNVAQA